MKSLRVLPILIALVTVPLSGCLTDMFEDQPIEDSVLARKVHVLLDEGSFEGDADFYDVVQVWFEYKHPGASVDASDVRVTFTDQMGEEQTKPITLFTSSSTLQEGDVVKITGVNITSGIKVHTLDDTLAQRSGLRAQWLRSDNTPLPIASTEAGRAVWSLTGSGGLSFDVKDVSLGEGGYVEYAKGDFKSTSDGTFRVVTDITGSATDLRYEIDTKGNIDAFSDARIRADGETADFGFDVDADGRLDGKFLMGFVNGELSRVGSGGSVFSDGQVHVWDPEHPKSDNWEPEDIDHPFVDEKEPYTEESIESDEWAETDEELIAFLEKVWSMTLDVGDEFRFQAAVDEDDHGFEFELVIQVTERVARNVGFDSIDTFRVHETMRLATRGEYGAGQYDLASFTTWLATDTYLPVYAQMSYSKTYDEREIRSFYALIEEEAPFELPDDLKFTVSSTGVLKLEEYSGDLTMSPLLGVTGLSSPMRFMGSGLGMCGFGGPMWDDGCYDCYDEVEPIHSEWEEPECYYDENGYYVCEPRTTECYWNEYDEYVCD